MPKTRIISPGIPNHKLLKNLELNGKWLTNDANEDEGISISDAGIVTVKSTGNASETVLRLNDSQADGQYIDIQYHNGGDELRFKDQGDAYVDFLAGPMKATTYQGNFNQASGDGTHAVNFTTAVTENQGGNTAGKPRMRFSDDANAGATATQKFALGSGTSRFVEMVETYNPPSGSVGYEFLSLKPTIDQIVNGVASVDTLTPTPSSAWQASQTHYDVAQTSTSGSGSGIKVRSITTNSDGNPTFVLETEFSDCGKNYAVDDTIVFTDPGSTSNTATLTVASVSNATGNYTAIKLNVTETSARGSANSLMDLQVGGSSKFKVDDAGNTTIGNIAAVGSDTDKFLMSDSGVVKYVTGANLLSYSGAQASLTFGIADTNAVKIDSGSVADDEYARFTSNGLESRSTSEVLSDIGAQATVTAGTNCTFSGATLNVDDAFVKNDADDTMTGTLTIDKNVTSTDAGTYRGLMVDFDKTGSSSSNNTLRGIEVDLTNTSATGGTNTVTGIRNDITVQHAADSGIVYLYGITNFILGHDNASGTAIGIINDVNNGSDQCVGYQSDVTNGQPDMKFVSSVNSADIFTIDTNANAETTFTTAQWQGNTSAHMNFVAGGNIVLDSNNDIEINANGGDITFKDDTTDLGSWDSSGNLLVKGDLIIDDGGSIKEAGGTAAITIDSAGEVSKIGQDSPSDGEVLTWDNGNSKVVWASAGGGSARSVAGDTDNGMITWVTSDNTFAAESNLTFDGTDLLIASTGKLAVGDTATYIHQASDSNLAVVADGDITLDAADDIVIDADGDIISLKFGGTAGQIDFTQANSGDGIIQQKVDAKDLVVKQYDGDEVIRFTDGGDVRVNNVVYFTTEATNTCDSSGGAASRTIDWNVSQKQNLTITGTSNTINFTNPQGPCNLQLKIVQGDGNDTITAGHYYTNVKWAGGARPTLSTGNGAIDIISLYFDGTSYHGVASLGFATA